LHRLCVRRSPPVPTADCGQEIDYGHRVLEEFCVRVWKSIVTSVPLLNTHILSIRIPSKMTQNAVDTDLGIT
jgi:hypothetical protein